MVDDYYSKYAESFYEGTVNLELGGLYKKFVNLLSRGALILDAGCGSGRDTLAFLKAGYLVEAFDASGEMVNCASRLTGIRVLLKRFDEIDNVNHYDGIWCCASLLHVPLADLPDVMRRLSIALKPAGIWYVSFKYGNGEREKDGRHFTDFNEESFLRLVEQLPGISMQEVWLTDDLRPSRSDKWLNGILKRN